MTRAAEPTSVLCKRYSMYEPGKRGGQRVEREQKDEWREPRRENDEIRCKGDTKRGQNADGGGGMVEKTDRETAS